MTTRYLIYFSYIGTRFRGSAKDFGKERLMLPDYESVQGRMEIALNKLTPLNSPIVLSSRTDAGVHALNATAHVDLENKNSKEMFQPELIKNHINAYFRNNDLSIYAKDVICVPDNFSARFNARSRTYLYRFATKKMDLKETNFESFIPPIEELNRCLFFEMYNYNFNINNFIEASKYLVGTHNFTSFKNYDKQTKHQNNRRSIFSIKVRASQARTTTYDACSDLFEYWEIEIHGNSFVYNQVRRMVGVLVAVGMGNLTSEDLVTMLRIPSKDSWPTQANSVPPHGLYLCNVEYDLKDLIMDKCNSNLGNDL